MQSRVAVFNSASLPIEIMNLAVPLLNDDEILVRVEATSIVANTPVHPFRPAAQLYIRLTGFGVLGKIIKRFLSNSIESHRGRPRQSFRYVAELRKADRDVWRRCGVKAE